MRTTNSNISKNHLQDEDGVEEQIEIKDLEQEVSEKKVKSADGGGKKSTSDKDDIDGNLSQLSNETPNKAIWDTDTLEDDIDDAPKFDLSLVGNQTSL